jgi:hypothetical protein
MPSERRRSKREVDAELRVIKTLSGDYYFYEFQLWDGTRPANSQRRIEKSDYDGLKQAIQAIKDHVADFQRELTKDQHRANARYRDRVEEWLTDISRLIKQEFLPAAETPFAAAMAKLEKQARRNPVNLLISTNEYLIPWWLTNPYVEHDFAESWHSLFSLGFLPLSIAVDKDTPDPTPKTRIALISRPSYDLGT